MSTWPHLDLRFASRVLLAAAFVACSGDTTKDDGPAPTDGDADTDTDTDADADCTATIVDVDPPNGATDVPFDAEVTVTYDQAITPSDPWSLDVSNATGNATLAGDGLSATWTGTLDPDTAYTVNAEVCGSSGTSTFTTAPPPIDLLSLEGNTYGIRWEDVVITEPGNDKALTALIPVDYVLAQIFQVDVGAQTADAVATIGDADPNDPLVALPYCDLAVLQTADFSQNPLFSISGTMTIVVNAQTGQTADIEDFEILGRISEDGSAITNVQLSGLVATEQFLEGEDCQAPLVQLLFPTCVPCTTSATGECMLLEGTVAAAPLQVGLDVAGQCGITGGDTGGDTGGAPSTGGTGL